MTFLHGQRERLVEVRENRPDRRRLGCQTVSWMSPPNRGRSSGKSSAIWAKSVARTTRSLWRCRSQRRTFPWLATDSAVDRAGCPWIPVMTSHFETGKARLIADLSLSGVDLACRESVWHGVSSWARGLPLRRQERAPSDGRVSPRWPARSTRSHRHCGDRAGRRPRPDDSTSCR